MIEKTCFEKMVRTWCAPLSRNTGKQNEADFSNDRRCYVLNNYKFAIQAHFKTVVNNRLRMCVVKMIFSPCNYKFATTSHSKTVMDNRLRMCVLKYNIFSRGG